MRMINSMKPSFLVLAWTLGIPACQRDGNGADATMDATGDGDGDGDTTGDGDGSPGDGDGDTGDGDGDGDGSPGDGDGDGSPGDGDGSPGDGDGDTGSECYPQPDECEVLVRCIAALLPDQAAAVEQQFGEGGPCWCGGADVAMDCYAQCIEQVDLAVETNPTESECHEEVCHLEELDPTQPYGPIINGACSDYINAQNQPVPQIPIANPLGVPGGVCSPMCVGLGNYCPEHAQTTAIGTCYLTVGQDNYCVSRCFVDPNVVGGAQCQCGATCQPQGVPDGEGNMRGICTFE